MHIAYHHILKRKKLKSGLRRNQHQKILTIIIDRLVYLSAFLGVFANIPQLTKIWIDKSVSGVSIITWIGFLVGSLFWLSYGIVHKETPIIITNGLYVTIQLFIVLGLFLQHVPFTFL